jgi:putative peptidoglycan lipid II flippase
VVLVPDFTPELQQLTADIMRIILIQTTIFGISGVFSSMLNAHQHFALPALAPLALDIGYVVGLYLFVPELGILGLAWGTVVGGVLHIGIQVPALVKYRIGYQPSLKWRLSGVSEIVRLMGPRIVTLGTVQIADLFIFRLTSGLPEGNTSGYFYGYALMQLPETVFGSAIALVILPTLAELFNAGEREQMRVTSVYALGFIWTLTIPAAALMVLLGEPAIAFLLEGDVFDAASTRLVYSVLLAFSVRLVSEATLEIVARLFYAQHDTRTPMFAYIGWLVVNVAVAYALVDSLGVVGLALASTVAFTLLSAVLFWLNRLEIKPLLVVAGRALAGTAVLTILILAIGQFITSTLLFLLAAGSIGVASYIVVNLLLGGKEIPDLLRLIRKQPA